MASQGWIHYRTRHVLNVTNFTNLANRSCLPETSPKESKTFLVSRERNREHWSFVRRSCSSFAVRLPERDERECVRPALKWEAKYIICSCKKKNGFASIFPPSSLLQPCGTSFSSFWRGAQDFSVSFFLLSERYFPLIICGVLRQVNVIMILGLSLMPVFFVCGKCNQEEEINSMVLKLQSKMPILVKENN